MPQSNLSLKRIRTWGDLGIGSGIGTGKGTTTWKRKDPPPTWKSYSGADLVSGQKCYRCGIPGHKLSECESPA
jgi:hypothetical protein